MVSPRAPTSSVRIRSSRCLKPPETRAPNGGEVALEATMRTVELSQYGVWPGPRVYSIAVDGLEKGGVRRPA